MSFRDAVLDALEVPNAEDSKAAVHHVVGNQVSELAPGVTIKRTDYFNHSFIPDLVISWQRDRLPQERKLFLRLTSEVGLDLDLAMLGSQAPLFMGLLDESSANANEGTTTGGALITDSVSIGELDDRIENDERQRALTAAIVRRGHGPLRLLNAQRVTRSYGTVLNAIDALREGRVESDVVGSALGEVGESLAEDGFIELEQVTQSLWIRSGGDPHDFPSRVPWNPRTVPDEVLRTVLLDLLDSGRPLDAEVWQRNAGHVGVEKLARVLGTPMRGGRFNEMAAALLADWTAQWVWAEYTAGGAVPFETEFVWVADGNLVGLEAGDLVMYFADDGRHFKDKKPDQPLPGLLDADEFLADPEVSAVSLVTPVDDVQYRLRRSGAHSVLERINKIVASDARASSYVQGLAVLVPERTWEADVNFARLLIDLDKRPTPVTSLARMAFRYFARSAQSQRRSLDKFLSSS